MSSTSSGPPAPGDRPGGPSGRPPEGGERTISELVAEVEGRRTVGQADRGADPSGTTSTPPTPPAIPAEVLEADADRLAGRRDPTPVTVVRPAASRLRRRRRVLRSAGVVALALVAYYLVSLFQVWSVGRSDDRAPVDAIVVMGAAQYDGRPSPQLEARLDHVVELWPEGLAPLVVVTGGNRPGDRFTEASASAAYLVERGIPAEAVVLEDEGSSSYESMSAVAELLAERGLDEIVVVTDPYHSMRSREIAEEVGLTAHVSSTDTSVVTGTDDVGRHLQEAAGLAVARLIGYDRLESLIG